jgi:hypothetical protein
VLKLVSYSRSRTAVAVVGLVATGFLLYSIIVTIYGCASEPVYVPPPCDEGCGEGTMTSACDGPGGVLAYGFAFLLGPITAFLSGLITFRVMMKIRRTKQEA